MLVYAGANVKATTRLGANTPLHDRRAQRQARRSWSVLLDRPGADAKTPTSPAPRR